MNSERELHLRDYLRVLVRRRWIAGAAALVVLAVAVVRALQATPTYRAGTRILIEKSEMQNLAVVNPIYSSWDPDFFRTQVQIIRSAATAERAARLLEADERWRALAPPGKGGSGARPAAAGGALARTIQAGLDATPEKDSKIVTVSFVSSEPAVAALVANTVVKAYVEQLFDMKMSYSRYAVEYMTEKAQEEGRRLEEAERRLQQFLKEHDLVTVENHVAGMPESVSELGLELTRAETRRRELEAVDRRLAAVVEDPVAAEAVPAVSADPSFQAVKSQLLRAEQAVLELAKKYGQRHPTMIAAREEVEALRARRAAEVRRIALGLRNELELAAAREADLRARLAAGRGEAIAAGEKLARYEELRRAVETNRQFYDTLLSRAKEESLTQQLQGVQVWTLEPAVAPDAPDGPRASRTLLLGLLAGLAAGIAAALFAEYLDTTVHSPEDLEARTRVPVLGAIPVVRGRGPRIEEAVLREPRQPVAESYKALRTAILLAEDAGPPKTILVTSTAPEEGKTATAVNLAVAIAQSGYSVLLVDADLRKPRIDRIFELEAGRGLSTFLDGTDEEPAIERVGVPNLAVLPAGPVPPNPSELLGSKRMEELLGRLRERYDLIVFDSPPFLTVADGLVLAKKLHAVIFVARAERSTYDRIRRGVKALADLGVAPLGLVLNAFDDRRDRAYYYYYERAEGEQGRRRRGKDPDEATAGRG